MPRFMQVQASFRILNPADEYAETQHKMKTVWPSYVRNEKKANDSRFSFPILS